jgi:hypothetical protein
MKLMTIESTDQIKVMRVNGAGFSESCRGGSEDASRLRTLRTRLETDTSRYLNDRFGPSIFLR